MSDLPFMVRAMPIIRWAVMGMYLSTSAQLILTDASPPGCVLFFSIVVLIANAHYIALEMDTFLDVDQLTWPTETPDTAAVLALGVAMFTLIMVTPM